MLVKIYHNPKCSKSRKALDILIAHSIRYEMIEYKKKGLKLEEVKSLARYLDLPVLDFVRTKEEEFKSIDIDWSDSDLAAEQLVKHPQLLERPIIIKGEKAIIARPPEKILEFLGI